MKISETKVLLEGGNIVGGKTFRETLHVFLFDSQILRNFTDFITLAYLKARQGYIERYVSLLQVHLIRFVHRIRYDGK